MRALRHVGLLIVFLLGWPADLSLRPFQARAGDLPLEVTSYRLGLGGKYKSGYWQPLWVTLRAGTDSIHGELAVLVPDGDQVPALYANQPHGQVVLSPGQEARYLLYARSGPIDAPVTLQLRSEQRAVWSRELRVEPTLAVPSTQSLVVGIGPSVALDTALAALRRIRDEPPQMAEITSPHDLPDAWWGYDGVDVVVLTTRDADFFQAWSDRQQQALVDWVLHGGRLILSVGERATALGSMPRWSALLPGAVAEVGFLRERSGLEELTREELPLDDPLWQRQRPPLATFRRVQGEILLSEISGGAGRPLVIDQPVGLGRVLLVALDLDHPALLNWPGRPRLLARLVNGLLGEGDLAQRDQRRAISHLGYRDLIGQLRVALDQFPGVWMVNFTTVAVLTLAYLLLAVPGDFFLLRQLAWPRHRTWLTFPLIVAAALAVGFYVKGQVHGRSERLNQVEILDIDLARQVLRGTAWCHLYSPHTRGYSARVTLHPPPALSSAVPVGWIAYQGLPGDGLGGLESRQPVLATRPPYRVALPAEDPALHDLVLSSSSTKSLAACWWTTTQLPHDLDLSVDRFGLLVGQFRQPLSLPLTDCILAHGEKLYRLGTLQPGQVVRMAELDPLNLEARLTQRRIEQTKDVSTPWEQDSVDVPRIVQMLMFHAAARGTSYTGLTHRYQPQLDLSGHVRLGRAVLVGRASRPVLQLASGAAFATEATPLVPPAQTQSWTWYRLVLPVAGPNTAVAAEHAPSAASAAVSSSELPPSPPGSPGQPET